MLKKVCALFLATALAGSFAVTDNALASKAVQEEVQVTTDSILGTEDILFLNEKKNDFLFFHPNASQDEVETYLKGIIHEEMAKTKSSQELGTEAYYLFGIALNPIEQALYNENPSIGDDALYEAFVAQTGASNTSLTGPEDGKQDAFRHAYWNALMVDEFGRYWSQRWGNAHEDGAVPRSATAKTMDLTNNERGRQAYEELYNSNPLFITDSAIKDKVMAWLLAGKMVYIDPYTKQLIPTNK